MKEKIQANGTDVMLDTPLIADQEPLKVLWITDATVKQIPDCNTNTVLAQLLTIHHVVKRIKEVHIYLKEEQKP